MKRVTVTYKSGFRLHARVDDDFTVTYDSSGRLTHIKWDKFDPRPLHIGINEVESIFMGHV